MRFVCVLILFVFCKITISQVLSGKIRNFNNKAFSLFIVYGDSLIFIDSVYTDAFGFYKYDLKSASEKVVFDDIKLPQKIIVRLQFNWNQFADLIVYNTFSQSNNALKVPRKEIPLKTDIEKDIIFNTTFRPSQWNNFSMDSGEVEYNYENKILYDFLNHYRKVKIADGWLLEMARLFPYSDEFSKVLIKEYEKRYKKMENFIKGLLKKPDSPAKRIALAYYRPKVPHYTTPDGLRFDTLRMHFWDYFDPNDSIFLFSSVLIDKLEEWVFLHHHHKKDIAGLYLDKEDIVNGINSYLAKINKNKQNFEMVLRYALKKLDMDEDKTMFVQVYDKWLASSFTECGKENNKWDWAHRKANIYKNIIPGSSAPDFEMSLAGGKESLSLYSIPADYIIIVFWSSWCFHCKKEVPHAKKLIDETIAKYPNKFIQVVAISLDTNFYDWKNYVLQNNLSSWINYSELKGWKGEISKKYGIYATPTFFLLDKDKQIIGYYGFIEKLLYYLEKDINEQNTN
ncbi:MAG: redoxin domain-containing protein [Bacteroidales bacterium]|nr:redoxin domain-containing protein [Bacteroidales bacterium]